MSRLYKYFVEVENPLTQPIENLYQVVFVAAGCEGRF